MKLPRFYPILDSAAVARAGLDPLLCAQQILDGGAEIVQYRHKGLFTKREIAVVEFLAKQAVQFIVNDRADLAAIFGAGLHLGQDDLPPKEARTVTGGALLIGYSTHNEAQLRAAIGEPVDYLALGPLFGTTSKERPDPVVGLEELRRLRSLTSKPLVAIGGITRANARQVLEAGADSVAIIGDLFPEDGDLAGRVREWRNTVS